MPTVKPKVFACTPTHTDNKSTSPWIWFSFRASATLMSNDSIAKQLQESEACISTVFFSLPKKQHGEGDILKKHPRKI